MHSFAAVVVPPGLDREEAEKHVSELMAPHEESWNEATEESSGFWDWWQIGGRWTGVWSEYDPHTDPRNVEPCLICGGTGRRHDADRFEAENPGWIEWSGGCNGCRGKGEAVAWPTKWVDHDGDIATVNAFLNNPAALRRPMTLVLPDGTVAHRSWWTGRDWCDVSDPEWHQQVDQLLEPYRGQGLVVVDYHA